jgi:hypothetical protein
MFVLRPLDKNLGRIQTSELRDPSTYHVVAGRGKIGDVACVMIETEHNPGMQESYWLDPNRDYLPLRKHVSFDGRDSARIDWTYRLDQTHGWIPSGWTDLWVGEDGASTCELCTVTSYSINGPLPPSEFELEPPKGAEVQDLRDSTSLGRHVAKIHAENAAALIKAKARARELARSPKREPKCIYDPFADAAADVDAAIKEAKQTHKQVLIDFGSNGSLALGLMLKEDVDVSAAVKKGFVLVLVDADFETGKKMFEKYAPKQQRFIPHLAVLDVSGTVLENDDAMSLVEPDPDIRHRAGNAYRVSKVKEFLALWSR